MGFNLGFKGLIYTWLKTGILQDKARQSAYVITHGSKFLDHLSGYWLLIKAVFSILLLLPPC